MFIGYYELNGQEYFNIYWDNKYGWDTWHSVTFSPEIENTSVLVFKTHGKTYNERKSNLEELAKEWQLYYGQLSWSYGELAEITDWFYKNAKRYGLVRIFKENAIY